MYMDYLKNVDENILQQNINVHIITLPKKIELIT